LIKKHFCLPKFYLFIGLQFLCFNLWATSDTTQLKQRNKNLIVLPLVYYSPETTLAFGLVTMNFFKLSKDPTDTITHTSNMRNAFVYTLNKQVVIDNKVNLLFKENNYWASTRFTYLNFPEFYYGIGNDTPDSNEESVSYQMINIEGRVLKKMYHSWYAGLQFNYQNMYNVSQKEDGLLDTEQTTGYTGGTSLGWGLLSIWDKRDNALNSSKGYYAELSARFFSKKTGSDFDYHMFQWDLRYFRDLTKEKKHILAFQNVATFMTGDPPFRRMGILGGSTIMRGLYQGRYRDRNLLAFQTEYRWQMLDRWALAAFAATGQVANHIQTFSLKDFKYTYGAGVRFMLNKKERVNLRLDFGLGKKTSGFYINLAESF
jgi:outer membrane protein assembly factor BamA